jgi:hypothetical protein
MRAMVEIPAIAASITVCRIRPLGRCATGQSPDQAAVLSFHNRGGIYCPIGIIRWRNCLRRSCLEAVIIVAALPCSESRLTPSR